MRGILRLACCLVVCLPVLISPVVYATAPKPGIAVVGYVFPQNTTLQPGQIDARSLTRINYAFANIENGRMVNGFSFDKENFAYLHSLKQENPDLTILVSVGGWLWSTNFSDVSLTAQSRAVFIQSVMDFLKLYDLDGLDIDWEYPGMPGAGHPFRSEDKKNFTLLLKELRSRFDLETTKTQKRLYLTIAAGASDEFLVHTEMDKVQRYVDSVNLMAYDYYEPDSDQTTGHHAPLFTNPADPKKISANASVLAFEKAGVPVSKILLGLPFYGHVWGQVADRNHGLYQSGKAIPNAYAPYHSIVETMLNHGFIRFWDPTASVPYLYNSEKQIFVSYEDSESLIEKCKYVQSHQLGGVMFWDYSGDPSGELLKTIHDALNTPAPKREAVQ
ncbi:glycoside hydrolase family 18 protein [Acidicapsa acidisoli]|uniref:glycoside hydrolase family 18 protein n=1 Tax=Acidicapsa acidisoli TaxID=1615681 RepID=UPI0021DF7F49|nr:glycoside hydrolase family 18 protein [Acidicapsa acidisoli]